MEGPATIAGLTPYFQISIKFWMVASLFLIEALATYVIAGVICVFFIHSAGGGFVLSAFHVLKAVVHVYVQVLRKQWKKLNKERKREETYGKNSFPLLFVI